MNKDIYKRRRQELLNQIGENDIVIVPTANVQSRNGDVYFRFRPDSDFYYLTGFEEPEAVMVICPARKQGPFIMFCRERDPFKEMWDGRRVGLEGAVEIYGADDAFPIEDLDDILPSLMEEKVKVYNTVGRYSKFDTKLLEWMNRIKEGMRQGKHAPYEFVDLNHILHEQRLIKRKDEVDLMRKAGKMSAAGHMRAMEVCKPGMYEYQVQAEMECVFRKGGSHYNAYPSIVAGGANACILHYGQNHDVLNDGEMLLIDAGAEFGNYAADITRTFPINGKFTGGQKALYEIVLAAQKASFAVSKPGVSWNETHDATVKTIAQGLIDVGLLKGSLEEVLETQTYTQFYMHRTGHWIGMDVHDVGDYQIEERWRELEPGMVFTIEPGVYVAPAENVDERWHNIGIRIEDDVLITKDGNENLTKDVVKEIADVEAVMAG